MILLMVGLLASNLVNSPYSGMIVFQLGLVSLKYDDFLQLGLILFIVG